jgi:hypothetical protein
MVGHSDKNKEKAMFGRRSFPYLHLRAQCGGDAMMGMIIGKICCLVMLCFALFVDLLLKRDASFDAFGNCNVHQYGVLVYCLKWLAIVMSVVGFRWIRTNRMLRDLFFVLFGVFIILQFLIV